MKNATMKRMLALVLALAMALSLASVSAFAAESVATSGNATQVESEVTNEEADVNNDAEIQSDAEEAGLNTAGEWVPLTKEDWNAGRISGILNNSWLGSPYIDESAYFSFPCGYDLIANVYKLNDKSWKMVVSGTGGMFDAGEPDGGTNGRWSGGAGDGGVLVDGELVSAGTCALFNEFFNAIGIKDENYSAAENGTTVEVIFNEGVTSIGTYAFSSCGGLTSVQFPSTLESIGKRAFCLTRNLTGTLTIPEGVKDVGETAFGSAGINAALTKVVINGDAVLHGDSFGSLHSTTEVVINGDATVKSGAFDMASALKKITINGNATIENSGFGSVPKLTDFIVNGKCVLKDRCFFYAPKLTNVSIAKGCTVDPAAFEETKYENTIAKNIIATKPASLSVSNKKTKKMTLKWKTVSYGQKYQIQYSTSKSFKNAKTKTVKGTSATISKLTKKKKYYVRVRAVFYNSLKDKTVYSKWSAVKTVTIKK